MIDVAGGAGQAVATLAPAPPYLLAKAASGERSAAVFNATNSTINTGDKS